MGPQRVTMFGHFLCNLYDLGFQSGIVVRSCTFCCLCFMDSSSACIIAVHVKNYVDTCDDGRNVLNPTKDFQLVVDWDTTNLKDLTELTTEGVKHGMNQGVPLRFWNKSVSAFSRLTFDALLMDVLNLYWNMRRVDFACDNLWHWQWTISQIVSFELCVDHVSASALATATNLLDLQQAVVHLSYQCCYTLPDWRQQFSSKLPLHSSDCLLCFATGSGALNSTNCFHQHFHAFIYPLREHNSRCNANLWETLWKFGFGD